MSNNSNNEGRIGTMYVRTFDTYTKLLSENKAEIALVGLTILAVKYSGLRKDIQNLSQASVIHSEVLTDTVKAMDMIIDRMKPMDVEVGWLREDMSDISRTFDDVFIRLEALERIKK